MTKLTHHLVLITAATSMFALGCPAGDDGDTGADTGTVTITTTMTMTTEPADTTEDPDPTEEPGETTEEPGETTEDPTADTGADCQPTDECVDDSTCNGGMCIDCECFGGDPTMGGCEPGTCGDCPDQNMCVACSQMMGGECEAQIATCQMNPACVAAVMCNNMCADAMCVQQCVADNPDGEADFNALFMCLAETCL